MRPRVSGKTFSTKMNASTANIVYIPYAKLRRPTLSMMMMATTVEAMLTRTVTMLMVKDVFVANPSACHSVLERF